ncbi:MAG: hypothetical protein NDI61_10675 [Bdellovibrionaceae bacterium]|nr:hypothetical protein [Pseudobdellovibrionaceae bacterium]
MKAVHSLIHAAILTGLILAGAQARAEITTYLVKGKLKAGGLIVGGFSTGDTTLVLVNDGEEFARLPVRVSGTLVGLLIGADSAHSVDLQIKGLSTSTKVYDLLTAYHGHSLGAAIVVPGPCCLGGSKKLIRAQSSRGDLELILSAENGVGLVVDMTKANVQIALQATSELSQAITPETTLSDLISRRRTFVIERDQKADIRCAIPNGNRSPRIVQIKIHDPLTLQSSGFEKRAGTLNVRAGLEGNQVQVNAKSKKSSIVMSLDLKTERPRVAIGDIHFEPRMPAVAYEAQYAETSNGKSVFRGSVLCNVFSVNGLEAAVRAVGVSQDYLESAKGL